MRKKQHPKYVVDQRLLVEAELYCGSDVHDVRSVLAAYKWSVEAANLGVQSGIDQIDVAETKLRTMLDRLPRSHVRQSVVRRLATAATRGEMGSLTTMIQGDDFDHDN